MNDLPTPLLAQLGERLGLPGLAWDQGGECTLQFGDTIALALAQDPDNQSLILYTVLGEVEEPARHQVYDHLLAANLFWKDTAGATLGADPDSGTIVMASAIPLALLDLDRLTARIEDFANLTAHWQRRLRDLIEDAMNRPPAAHAPTATQFIIHP